MPQMTANSLAGAVLSSNARQWVDHYARRPLHPSVMRSHLESAGLDLSVSDDDLRSADERAALAVSALDDAVSQCPNVSEPTQRLWQSFYAKYQDIHKRIQDNLGSITSRLHNSSLLQELNATKPELDRIQGQVSTACPKLIPQPGAGGKTSSWTTALIVVAVVAAVITGFWFLSPLVVAAARPRAPGLPR